MKNRSKKLKDKAYSVKLMNASGNFQEYDITEEDFNKLSVKNMLKYILYNNQNVNDFNYYYYDALRKKQEEREKDIKIGRVTKRKSIKRSVKKH